MYDIIYLTNLPSFYKINLFNRIKEHKKLLVIFTGYSSEMRKNDFFAGNMGFEYLSIEELSLARKLKIIYEVVRKNNYNQLVISGINEITSWFAAFISPVSKNATIIESSYHETCATGVKALIKRLFFKRISVAFVSGKAQDKYTKLYKFKGEVIITKGVGIFNIIEQPPYIPTRRVTEFIYVGRLSPEKNLVLLINVFNQLFEHKLHIVGYGPQEAELRQIANENVIFYGAVDNRRLPELYQSCDVFILPSIKEPWGLVVEEAFNNGLPVLVSNKVGCAEEIIEENRNGLVFDYNSENSLLEKIKKISDLDYYNSLKLNISKMDFNKIADYQVNCYL